MELGEIPGHVKITGYQRIAAAVALLLANYPETAVVLVEEGRDKEIPPSVASLIFNSLCQQDGQASSEMLRLRSDFEALDLD